MFIMLYILKIFPRSLEKKQAHSRRVLRTNNLYEKLLVYFYRCSIERILWYCVCAWFLSCTAADRKALQRVTPRPEDYQTPSPVSGRTTHFQLPQQRKTYFTGLIPSRTLSVCSAAFTILDNKNKDRQIKIQFLPESHYNLEHCS